MVFSFSFSCITCIFISYTYIAAVLKWRNFVCVYSQFLFFFLSFFVSLPVSYTTKTKWNQWPTKSEQNTSGVNDNRTLFSCMKTTQYENCYCWSCPCLLLIFHPQFIDFGIIASRSLKYVADHTSKRIHCSVHSWLIVLLFLLTTSLFFYIAQMK